MLLPPRLFGTIAYYVAAWRHPDAAIATGIRYDKSDKGTHRYDIADTRGLLRLTVPVSRPAGATLWRQCTVSDHGRWWETMPTALESAYGRTPFFEFYIDRLRPLFSPEPISVTELCLRSDAMVRGILAMPPQRVAPEAASYDHVVGQPLPFYWQVRGDSLGFIGGLSVLDLIFNLGPEAQLYLDTAAKRYA